MGGEIARLYEESGRPSSCNASRCYIHSIYCFIDISLPLPLPLSPQLFPSFSPFDFLARARATPFTMSLLTNMTDKTLPRGFRWIWFIRLLQLVIALLVLILAAVDIQSVRNLYDGCGTPSRIAFNLACVSTGLMMMVLPLDCI